MLTNLVFVNIIYLWLIIQGLKVDITKQLVLTQLHVLCHLIVQRYIRISLIGSGILHLYDSKLPFGNICSIWVFIFIFNLPTFSYQLPLYLNRIWWTLTSRSHWSLSELTLLARYSYDAHAKCYVRGHVGTR